MQSKRINLQLPNEMLIFFVKNDDWKKDRICEEEKLLFNS
jgi:hypothetical protein